VTHDPIAGYLDWDREVEAMAKFSYERTA